MSIQRCTGPTGIIGPTSNVLVGPTGIQGGAGISGVTGICGITGISRQNPIGTFNIEKQPYVIYKMFLCSNHDYQNPNIPIKFELEKHELKMDRPASFLGYRPKMPKDINKLLELVSKGVLNRTFIGTYTLEIDGDKSTIKRICWDEKNEAPTPTEFHDLILEKCKQILKDYGKRL